MGFHFLQSLILFLLVMPLISRSIDDDPIVGYGEEEDALYALKSTFHNPFLDMNWSGTPCYMNKPSNWYGIRCADDGRVIEILLEGLGLTGTVKAGAFVKFVELSVLSLRNNLISGSVMDLSFNQKLTSVDLSNNTFNEPIPRSLALGLEQLQLLHLQDNALTGSIPEFNQPSLKEFNVSNNNLSGPIPNTKVLQSFRYTDSYSGNYELCGLPSPNPCNSTNDTTNNNNDNKYNTTNNNSDNKKKDANSKKMLFAIIFIIFDIVCLIVVILLFILYYKKLKKLKRQIKAKSGGKEEEEDEEEREGKKVEENGIVVVNQEKGGGGNGKLVFLGDHGVSFELGDLLKASAEGLGKGNFGNCYKAKIDGGPAVVVKRLMDLKPLSSEEFAKQMRVIADQKHPNLLPLLAYCYDKDEKLAVFKCSQNGNLFNRIHGRRGKDRIPFRWNSRLSVARSVARALEYLHVNTTTTTKSQTSATAAVPHGNLKSSNVLFDDNEETVLVSDYGFTSLIALPIAAQRMVSYKSPEYQNTKKVSKKSDVWSYGILLLELLTGRISASSITSSTSSSSSSSSGIKGVDLSSWVHRAVREEWTAEIFDFEISVERGASHDILKLLQIAIRCCDKSPEKRPDMTAVVREIENLKDVEESEDDDDLSSTSG